MYTYYDFSKPSYFIQFSKKIYPWIFRFTFSLLSLGFFLSIFIAPSDFQQGENYRIIYIHVPAAWICIWMYICLTFTSVFYLIKKHPFLDLLSQSFANIGFIFTILTLITGSLWGAPMWGTFWVWDARLTSVLVLFFIYLGYIIVRNVYSNTSKASHISSILAIIGFINIPIIKFSVEWWNTLHQPSSITKFGTTIHTSMLIPILIMAFSLMIFSFFMILIYLRILILNSKLNHLKIAQLEKINIIKLNSK